MARRLPPAGEDEMVPRHAEEVRALTVELLPPELWHEHILRHLSDVERDTVRRVSTTLRHVASFRAATPTWGHVRRQEPRYRDLCELVFRDALTDGPSPLLLNFRAVFDALTRWTSRAILWTEGAQRRYEMARQDALAQLRRVQPGTRVDGDMTLYAAKRALGDRTRYGGDAAADAAELAAMATDEERDYVQYRAQNMNQVEADERDCVSFTLHHLRATLFFLAHAFWRDAYARGTFIARFVGHWLAAEMTANDEIAWLDEGPYAGVVRAPGTQAAVRAAQALVPVFGEAAEQRQFTLTVERTARDDRVTRTVPNLNAAFQSPLMVTAAMSTNALATDFPQASRTQLVAVPRAPPSDAHFVIGVLASNAGGVFRLARARLYEGLDRTAPLVFSGDYAALLRQYDAQQIGTAMSPHFRLVEEPDQTARFYLVVALARAAYRPLYLALEMQYQRWDGHWVTQTISCLHDPTAAHVTIGHAVRIDHIRWPRLGVQDDHLFLRETWRGADAARVVTSVPARGPGAVVRDETHEEYVAREFPFIRARERYDPTAITTCYAALAGDERLDDPAYEYGFHPDVRRAYIYSFAPAYAPVGGRLPPPRAYRATAATGPVTLV